MLDALNAPEFVERAVSGDPEAFTELFDAIVGPLAHFAEKMGLPPEDAEEIAADTLVKVHNALPRFRPRGVKLTTWIFEIARNSAIDRLRAVGKRSPHEEAVLAEYARAQASSDPSFSARLGVLQNMLQSALSRLSEGDRDILLMREVMEYSEIARAEGISEEAARTRHKRALDRLLEKIRGAVPDV